MVPHTAWKFGTARGGGWLPWLALGAALAAGGAVSGCTTSTASSPGTSATSGSAAVSACAVTPVANQVIPTVVTITAHGPGGSGTGSGEVIRSDGYILTNNHVISIAAVSGGSVEVQFSDGETAAATITGRDPQTDLAVLKIQTSRELKVISLGSSSSVQVGQPVVAIGAPLGLSGTVTSGIVSALNRTVEVPGDDRRSALLVSAVQTDTSINPGNSGGALVNCAGQLVGVPTAGATAPGPSGPSGGSIGLGFAGARVDLAKSIADEIITTGRVTHAYFGVQTVPIPTRRRRPGWGARRAIRPGSVGRWSGGHGRAAPQRRDHQHRRQAGHQQYSAARADLDRETGRHGVHRLRQSWSLGKGDGHAGRTAMSWHELA